LEFFEAVVATAQASAEAASEKSVASAGSDIFHMTARSFRTIMWYPPPHKQIIIRQRNLKQIET
jgi:hypothetical protein